METSLAQQLKKLAVPQTTLFFQDRVKVSFLFDPSTVANLSRDEIYDIGITGLQELSSIQNKFEIFEQTLFSETSKRFERSCQTAEVNAKLDSTIDNFLTLLSPYFLLRPAHKALEWLVCRYHIHMFNIDSLISCILPYHETRHFVRALQMIDLSNPAGRWHWLKPLQKPGFPLSKLTLFTHAYDDLSFLKFICEMVPKAISVYKKKTSCLRITISFYVSTVLGALENIKKITETLIATLLPFIFKGLKSELRDYRAASFMIICQLVRKTNITPSLLKEFVINITKNLKPLTKEATVCLLIIYQHQQLKEFPKQALLNVKKYPEFVKTLKKLDCSYSLTTFLIPFLQELTKSSVKAKLKKKGALLKILNNILNNIDISDKVVTEILKTLLGEYNRLHKNRTKLTINTKLLTRIVSSILLKLEKRYSEEFDNALEKYIQCSPKNCDSIQKLLCSSFSEPKHNILSSTGISLFIGVNHSNDVIRTASVKTFIANIQGNEITDKDFIKNTVISRLEDSCPDIVYPILSLDKMLYEIIPEDILYTKILKLLNEKDNTSEWFQVHQRIVHIACNFPFNDDRQNKWLAIIFSHLLPKNDKGLAFVKVIMSSVLSKNNPLLQDMQNAMFLLNEAMKETTPENILKLNCRIIEIIGSLLLRMNHLQRQILLDNLKTSVNLEGNAFIPLKLMVGLLLHFLISHESDINYQLSLALDTIQYIELLLPLCKMSPFKEEFSLQDVMAQWIKSRDRQLPSGLIIFCLNSLMQNIKSELFNLENQWLQVSNTPFCLNKYHASEKLKNWTNWNTTDIQEYYQLFLFQLFKMITEQASLANSPLKVSFQGLLKTFLKSYLSDIGKRLLFLSSLWSTHLAHLVEDEKHTCSILQIRSLVITGVTIFKPEEVDQLVFEDNSVVFPSLLTALISSLEEIREAALNVLGKMTENYKTGSTVYFAMTHKILQKREEIQSDNEQLSNLISEWYESSTQRFKTRRSLAMASMILKPILQQIVNKDTPDYIKHGLLLVLKETNSKGIISVLLPLLKSKLKAAKEKALSSIDFAIVHLLMLKYSLLTVDLMTSVDSDVYLIFDDALKITEIAEEKDTRIQQIAVNVLTKEYFASIPSQEVQQKILSDLTDLYLNSESADTKRLLHKTLRKLLDNAILMVNELQKFEKTTASTTLRETKRLRVQQSEMLNKPEILEEEKWKKIIIILEIIENKKKIRNIELLFPVLFNLLNRSLEIENHPSVEYLRQVTLSSLQNCCELLENIHLDERKFQVEIIVQCIRISNNPQTQNQALIVLNMAAKLFPEHVLHNIMTIFTFMGASLVRQDTSYSFQVISQTVETVIPALLQATSQKQDDDILQVVGNLTRVFIDALPDIPEHRRQPLFTKLLLTLGSEKFLWLILCQVFEICVKRKIKDDGADQDSKMPSPLTDFSMLLCQHFPVDVQLNVCVQLINYLLTLPNEIEFETKKRWQKVSLEPFDIKNHTINQLKYFKYNTVSFMISLLSSQAFVGQVVEMNKKKKKLDKLYEKMMELTLQYIQKTAHLFQENKENSNLKFWKAFLHKLYDLLDKVNSLLPSQHFIFVVRSLMKNKLSPVRHKAMEMLSAKLLHQSEFFSTDDHPALLTLVRPLLNILKKKWLETSTTSEEDTDLPLEITKNDQIVNSQIAFYCLKLLCRMLGSSNPEAFVKVLKMVINVLENPSISYQLTSSALLCLAELCSSLGIQVLPFLVDFMPPLISILQDLEVLNSNSLLLISIVTTVQHLTEHLCSFLSTYMDQLLTQVCIICATTSNTDGQNASLHQRLNNILEHLAVTVPLRILLPSIVHCYENVNTTRYKAIESLIFVFTKKITSIDKSEFNSYLKNLQVFFYLMFEFRCTNEKLPLTEIDKVEQHVINAFGIMVSKLSETTFRPMFFKLYDWATTSEEIDRILIFYKITENLSEKLKSLFILFTGHFIKNAASLLDNNNVSKTIDTYFHDDKRGVEKSCCLLKHIFNTLYKCFLYDNEKFVDKSIFNIIMQPLVDQIENVIGTEEDYQDRITNCVSPCIAQFSVTIGDNSLWKSLNYQIMLKTRHNSAKIRFATLHVLHEVVKKLGEEYLSLLPESIPFLAELMEDESPEVEKQCQSVLLDMEKILGEPLMKYFV